MQALCQWALIYISLLTVKYMDLLRLACANVALCWMSSSGVVLTANQSSLVCLVCTVYREGPFRANNSNKTITVKEEVVALNPVMVVGPL